MRKARRDAASLASLRKCFRNFLTKSTHVSALQSRPSRIRSTRRRNHARLVLANLAAGPMRQPQIRIQSHRQAALVAGQPPPKAASSKNTIQKRTPGRRSENTRRTNLSAYRKPWPARLYRDGMKTQCSTHCHSESRGKLRDSHGSCHNLRWLGSKRWTEPRFL